jgi:hypothetical protein
MCGTGRIGAIVRIVVLVVNRRRNGEYGAGGGIYGSHGNLCEKGFDECFPRTLERVSVDAQGFEGGEKTEPAGEGVHLVSADRERMEFV